MSVVFDGIYWRVSLEPDNFCPKYKIVVIQSKTLQRKYSKGITPTSHEGSRITEIWFGARLKNPKIRRGIGRCEITGQLVGIEGLTFREFDADITFKFKDFAFSLLPIPIKPFVVEINAREEIPNDIINAYLYFYTGLDVYLEGYVRSGILDDYSLIMNCPVDEIFSWPPCRVQYHSRDPIFSRRSFRVQSRKGYAISIVPFWYIVEKYKIGAGPYKKYMFFDPYTLYFYYEGKLKCIVVEDMLASIYPLVEREHCSYSYWKENYIKLYGSGYARLYFFVENRDLSLDDQKVCSQFSQFTLAKFAYIF